MLRRRGAPSCHVAARMLLASGALLWVGMLAAAPQASAQTTIQAGCMQEIAGFGLNCTANDVQLASARNITILDDGCAFPGDMVTFSADFEVVLTAQERHDIGIYFATDGDTNRDGAISGMCTLSTVAYQPDPPNLDLDGTRDGGFCANDATRFCRSTKDCRSVGGACNLRQDTCGDIDARHNPLFPRITLTTACIDPDGDGFLNLPNCTSWRQPGANTLCLGPRDAFPGSPSKCRCDLGFEVPIVVPAPILRVEKTADPTSVDEPGGNVTFTVTITNPSPFASVTLNQVADDVDNDGTDDTFYNPATICGTMVLAPSAMTMCTFVRALSGNGGDELTDVVTVRGTDSENRPVSASDDATVTINDRLPSIRVTKTADPTQVLEPGGNVNFTVRVENISGAGDPVTIDSLTDTIHGDLNGQGSCSVPQTIQPSGSYSCSFLAFVAGNAGEMETDVVTAQGADDEGNPVMASDSATVDVNDVPSMIELIKTADPTVVNEPGADVTFRFQVNNRSSVDTVTIDSLMDSIYGNLDGQGDCSVPQMIPPGGFYSCTISVFLAGNAFDSVTNVATASGVDDDGAPVSDSDDATVSFDNVAPSAALTKTATMADVTFAVEVSNDSNSQDPLELTRLDDDVYGDITVVQGAVQGTTCRVPQTIEPGGSYACSFVAKVNAPGETDTVTGTLADDDGSAPLTPSDSATVSLD